jgi:hypothetical protein
LGAHVFRLAEKWCLTYSSFQRRLESSAFIFGAQHRQFALRGGYNLDSSFRWNDGVGVGGLLVLRKMNKIKYLQ